MDTLPKRLLHTAKTKPDKVAFRRKDYGIWMETTWAEYCRQVKFVCLGFYQLGLRKGDKISILSENRPEWLYADLAAQSLGAITVGIYSEGTPGEIEYALKLSDSKFLILEDQEQTDKFLDISQNLALLEKAFVIDWRGMRDYKHPQLDDFKILVELGMAADEKNPELFENLVSHTCPDDPAVMSWTSGTTGNPKGVLLSHKGFIQGALAAQKVYPIKEDWDYLSYLPMPWVGERANALGYHLTANLILNFPERFEMPVIMQNISEILPERVVAPPRIWENLSSLVFIKMQDASWLKRTIYSIFMPVGMKVASLSMTKRAVPGYLKMVYALGDLLLFAELRDALGLNFAQDCLTGGAAIGSEVFQFFHAIGVKLRQIYGQTELCLAGTMQPSDEVWADTVGKPLPGVEIKISPHDEILIKSEGVFLEYYKNSEATAKTKDDGWVHTGDIGFLDQKGHLVVIDRDKDAIKGKNGQIYSPQLIENSLKFSPFIKEVVVIAGESYPYVTCLIQIDLDNAGNWAQRRQIPYTTIRDLSQKQEILALIEKEVQRVNEKLVDEVKIRRFKLLEKELDPDEAEITRTAKVRRATIVNKYKDIIGKMYND